MSAQRPFRSPDELEQQLVRMENAGAAREVLAAHRQRLQQGIDAKPPSEGQPWLGEKNAVTFCQPQAQGNASENAKGLAGALVLALVLGCGGSSSGKTFDGGQDAGGPDASEHDASATLDAGGTSADCAELRVVKARVDVTSAAELEALRCVREVTQDLVISGDDITDLGPLAHLERAGALVVVKNPLLRDLHGLLALSSLKWGIHVCGNPTLEGLLPVSTSVTGEDLFANVIYNASLSEPTVQGFLAQVVTKKSKAAANGGQQYEPPAVCPFRHDGTCDEPTDIDLDLAETCDEPPCCDLGGPTALCAEGTDDPTACLGDPL